MTYNRFTAYEGPENYIFVSYAHKDTDRVFPIMEALHNRGYRIWYDEGIAPGSEWPEDIAQHMHNSAMVIAFISANSMVSVNCRREINFALSKQKPFLPLFLEPTDMPLGMELQLSAQQSVLRHNYSSEAKFIEKICACPDIDCCRIASAQREAISAEGPRSSLNEKSFQEETDFARSKPAVTTEEKTLEKSENKKNGKGLAVITCALILAVVAAVLFFCLPSGGQTGEAADTITVYASVPDDWQDPHCWAWAAKGDVFDEWPGESLAWNGSWYTISIPGWASGVLINSVDMQTYDIPVEAGYDVWIVVRGEYCQYFYEEPTQAQVDAVFAG